MTSEWLRPAAAAEYAGISRRTIYCWFNAGLKYSKVGSCRLVKRSHLDEYIETFAVEAGAVDAVVDDLLKGIAI